jgi:hypothetical protein
MSWSVSPDSYATHTANDNTVFVVPLQPAFVVWVVLANTALPVQKLHVMHFDNLVLFSASFLVLRNSSRFLQAIKEEQWQYVG